jgi:CBS domain-containing protein
MLLKSICTLEVARCGPQTTVLEAAYLMRRGHTGDLVVCAGAEEGEAPIGVITDRDIVVEVLAKGLDPAATTVASVMRTPVVVANETEDTSQALERMKHHGVRRIPVVGARGHLMGIVTVDDLVKGLAAEAGALAEILAREQSHEQRNRR